MKIQLVGERVSKWGEGPVWYRGCIYYIDIEGHAVIRFDPETGEEKVWPVGERIGTLVMREKGGFVIAGDSGFRFLDEETGELTAITDPESDRHDNRMNDGKCSPDGRFFAGSISTVKKQGDASLYVLERDHSVSKVFGEVTNSNGIAWSPDGSRVYYIDTPRQEIWGFDYDAETGAWSHREVVVRTHHIEGSPDGMTIDSEGMLWVAFCHGGVVARFDVATGEEVSRVELPCVETTSCCWGGEQLDELYVTTGIHKSLIEEVAGRLFVVKGLGVKGLPAETYAG